MKDAPAPAGARCMRAARAASRGRPASRLPAGGGRTPPSLAWGRSGLRSGGTRSPSLLPYLVGSDGLYVARWRARRMWAGAARARRTARWRRAAGGGVQCRSPLPAVVAIGSRAQWSVPRTGRYVVLTQWFALRGRRLVGGGDWGGRHSCATATDVVAPKAAAPCVLCGALTRGCVVGCCFP